MDQLSGGNSANNPRMDLLHGTGNNQLLTNTPSQPGSTPYANAATPQPAAMPAPQPAQPSPQPPAAPVSPVAPPANLAPPSNDFVQTAKLGTSKPDSVSTPPEPRPATPPPGAPMPGGHHGPVIAGVLIAVLLLLGAGVGGWWFFTQRQAATPEPVATVEVQPGEVSSLVQQTGSGITIDDGNSTSSTALTLMFTMPTSANRGAVTPEVEVQPLGTAFTGKPTNTGSPISADGHDMNFKVATSALTDGKYRWQARVSKNGQAGAWKEFNSNATLAAFVVDTNAPAQPTVANVSGKKPANPITLQTNRPEFSGTSEPGSKVAITIAPENTTLNAQADAAGAWKVAATSDVPNGQHDVTIIATDSAGNASQATKLALSLNPATVADTAARATATAAPATTTPAASAPATVPEAAAVPTKLAATGDGVALPTLLSLGVVLMAIGGLLLTRRRSAHF